MIKVIPTQNFSSDDALVYRTGFIFYESKEHVKGLSTYRMITEGAEVTTDIAGFALRIGDGFDVTFHALFLAGMRRTPS